jgi:hypothetical protein
VHVSKQLEKQLVSRWQEKWRDVFTRLFWRRNAAQDTSALLFSALSRHGFILKISVSLVWVLKTHSGCEQVNLGHECGRPAHQRSHHKLVLHYLIITI